MALATLRTEGAKFGVFYPAIRKTIWCKDAQEAYQRLDRANNPKAKPKKKGKK